MSEKVKESGEYDNFLGEVDDNSVPATLSEFLGEDDGITVGDVDIDKWTNHWNQMPEYKQEDNPAYMKVIVRFRNKEDYEEFQKMIGQNMTEKTKSIWHPQLDRTGNALLRWIEDEE
jgi:hypothetical protein